MKVNNKNIIVYVSSRNNYDMLEGEVFKNIDLEGFEFINVDDKSSPQEISKGKALCKDRGIVFLENKSRGVQMATQTLIDYINVNRPECKWIICFQHDNYPISKNFFSTISLLIEEGKLENFGILGFNNHDTGGYTLNSLEKYNKGERALGMIGMAHLSIKNRVKRWLCPKQQSKVLDNPIWDKPFIIEWPMAASQGINVNLWNKVIKPTDKFQFFLWSQDIAMQFTYNGYPCLIIPYLHCINDQKLKAKYDININSAAGAMNGNEYHFGEYSNFNLWKERWGWDYENVEPSFESIKYNYKGTLIWDFYHHNINNGPLKTIEL